MTNRRDRTYYSSSIWCYTDKLSFLPGETIAFRVSSPEPTFACKISRVGVQEVVVFEQDGYIATPQEIPDDVYQTGCQWFVAFELKVPMEWSSGYYRVQLIAEQSDCEHFVVIKFQIQENKQISLLSLQPTPTTPITPGVECVSMGPTILKLFPILSLM